MVGTISSIFLQTIAHEPRATARVGAVVVGVLSFTIGGLGLVLPKRVAPKLHGFGVDRMKERLGVEWTVRIFALIILGFGTFFVVTAFTCYTAIC